MSMQCRYLFAISWPPPLILLSKDDVGFLLGYRAVPLKNNYSEDLELASLLVKIDIFPGKVNLVF